MTGPRLCRLLATVVGLAASALAQAEAAPERFTRLDVDGAELRGVEATAPGSPAPGRWACSRDNATRLTWEIKTDDGGLRDRRWSFTPFLPEWQAAGIIRGYRDTTSGSCARPLMEGESCNTGAYIDAINRVKLCGFADWRLPTVKELLDITARRTLQTGTDTDALPIPLPGWYWTGTTNTDGIPFQRVMLLDPGGPARLFDGTYHLWLVRGP